MTIEQHTLQTNDFENYGTLVHLNVQAAVDNDRRINSIIVRERPFIGDLALDAEPDKQLLIALGEVMSVSQPLTVNRISCMGRLAILWVNENSWLVLPAAGAHESVTQALYETFGSDLTLDEPESGQLSAQLTPAAINYLLSSSNTRRFSELNVSEEVLSKGVNILTLKETQDYDILVRKSCAESLWEWLQQNTQSQHSLKH
ncbi:sarcosine oxidase subunit gamma family protein [Neptuniibacter sp.]|uniref:sarcosine oxidase subunit gamma family protein n=1 Tax=Neptuniibacter sp. TaxID=1962643 RepID=UPI002618CEA3|nr:sarcosine oxidase subunit gamma family protein [Neptuniibacter sp.]MCP4597547.1 hypothetical protein [Neptuniibacter sp.]